MNKNGDLNHEIDNSVQTAYLFDVDGVITDPETKRLEKPQITDFIVGRLRAGDPVALVTGRALHWVMDRVVPYIKERTRNEPELLNKFYVSGEFGGAYVTWQNGKETHYVDERIRVPNLIKNDVNRAIGNYSNTHQVDPDKETMISLEMLDGLKVDEFKPEQLKFAKELQEIVEIAGMSDQFEVHIDRIATNIRARNANKYYAAEQVANWIKETQPKNPAEFITFGDSATDTEMSEQLQKMGLNTRLIFVGGREHLDGKSFDFPVEFTEGHCDNGVIEFINKFEQSN